MAASQRPILHRDHGFCADAGPNLLERALTELRKQQLLIRLRLGVPGEDQFAPVGRREMHGEELHGGKLLKYDARREPASTSLEGLFERDLQTLGHESDEDVRLDALSFW